MPHAAAPTAARFEPRTADCPVLGIGTATPRLSWIVPEAPDGWVQTGYEVEVTRGGATVACTVDSAEQVLLPWPVEPLLFREAATVRVRVRGGGDWSEWRSEERRVGKECRSRWSPYH